MDEDLLEEIQGGRSSDDDFSNDVDDLNLDD